MQSLIKITCFARQALLELLNCVDHLQFHLETFEFMMILCLQTTQFHISYPTDHASSPCLPLFSLTTS